MRTILLFALLATSAHALQPADVRVTTDPAVTVRVTPRAGNTSKTVDVTANKQDHVTQCTGSAPASCRQVYPATQTCPDGTVILKTSTCAPVPPADHHAGIHVADPSTWPKGNPADAVGRAMFTQEWIDPNGPWKQKFVTPSPVPSAADWEASSAVRSIAAFVRMAYDDMIVYPGQPGLAHHHTFYGNATSTALTRIGDIRTGCMSTARGGTMNCSEYWHPSVIDTLDGVPVRPKMLLIYYKDGNRVYMGRAMPGGGTFGDTIQPFPAGLVMIAGDATRSTPGGVGTFSCLNPSDGGNARAGQENLPNIPACETGDELWMKIPFPQCWDGKNLDSPDHKSHMAYPTNDNPGLPPGRSFDCPATHPVLLPQVTLLPIYQVTDKAAFQRWRLSSDVYAGPAGYSLHADWRNGWDPDVMNALWRNCWQPRRECGSFDLGDGRGAAEFGSN
jgi:hypothetical protein